jgi:hypothetical protein
MSDNDQKPPIPREDGPNLPPTSQLSKDKIESEMLWKIHDVVTSLAASIKVTGDDVATMKVDVGLVVENGRITNERLGRLELWRENVEGRLSKTSERVRDVTGSDLKQQADIAAVITENATLRTQISETHTIAKQALDVANSVEAKTDEQTQMLKTTTAFITNTVADAAKSPWGKRVGIAFAGLILLVIGWLSSLVQAAAAKNQLKVSP